MCAEVVGKCIGLGGVQKFQVEVPAPPGSSQTRAYRVGRGNDDLQLMLQATIELKNGQKRDISILVDTGAQANLIRDGVVPSYQFPKNRWSWWQQMDT